MQLMDPWVTSSVCLTWHGSKKVSMPHLCFVPDVISLGGMKVCSSLSSSPLTALWRVVFCVAMTHLCHKAEGRSMGVFPSLVWHGGRLPPLLLRNRGFDLIFMCPRPKTGFIIKQGMKLG